jgi:drug/metabolite transporter (DMT)-like permease
MPALHLLHDLATRLRGAVVLVGVSVIVVGVLSLAGGERPATRASVLFALGTGVAIAAYTLWDAHAVRDLGQSALVYYWGSEATRALLLAAPGLRERERLRVALNNDCRA